jgi:hypothetical protein
MEDRGRTQGCRAADLPEHIGGLGASTQEELPSRRGRQRRSHLEDEDCILIPLAIEREIPDEIASDVLDV